MAEKGRIYYFCKMFWNSTRSVLFSGHSEIPFSGSLKIQRLPPLFYYTPSLAHWLTGSLYIFVNNFDITSTTTESINVLIFGARPLRVRAYLNSTGPPSTDIKISSSESIHVLNVDKNGGKIWKIRFLKKVLKLTFPKVYFFGSLRNSLLPISQNRYFAAIFCRSENMPQKLISHSFLDISIQNQMISIDL